MITARKPPSEGRPGKYDVMQHASEAQQRLLAKGDYKSLLSVAMDPGAHHAILVFVFNKMLNSIEDDYSKFIEPPSVERLVEDAISSAQQSRSQRSGNVKTVVLRRDDEGPFAPRATILTHALMNGSMTSGATDACVFFLIEKHKRIKSENEASESKKEFIGPERRGAEHFYKGILIGVARKHEAMRGSVSQKTIDRLFAIGDQGITGALFTLNSCALPSDTQIPTIEIDPGRPQSDILK